MMGRTLMNLERVDVGFEPNGLLTVGVLFPRESDTVKLLHRYEEVLAILRQMPGVRSAAAADSLPMLGLVNRPMINGQSIDQRIPSTDGLVETLGMRVVAGRSFSADEARAMAPVAMLSLGALQLIWPGMAPHEVLGRVLSLDNQPGRQVIGIVSDVRPSYRAPSVPSLYEPMGPRTLNAIGVLFAVRVSPGHAVMTTRDLSRQFERHGVTPQKVSINVVADDFAAEIVNEAFRAKLFALFSIVAIALAATGIYSVQSFAVSLRRLEFGIRVSVGARLGDLWLLLLRDLSRPVIAGLVAGALVAYWASQFLRIFLYGIDGHDGWTFVGVAGLLIAMTAAAVFAPARRASLIDPVTILRS
jgi:putative ABC transport system permease protein